MPRLTKLYDDTRGRIARVLSIVRGEPTGARPTTNVRIKLGALPAPLRAVVRDESHGGILLEAELPWLTVGSDIQAEFPDGRETGGRVQWFGVDATRAGSARLRIFVDLTSPNAPVPTQLPEVEHLVRARPKRWAWAVATIVLITVASGIIYAFARRPMHPTLLPSPVETERTPPPAPAATVAVPKAPPEVPQAQPAVAAAPKVTATPRATPPAPPPRTKQKRKRR